MAMDHPYHNVSVYDDVDESLFTQILFENKPAILRQSKFGECMNEWTLDYLNDKIGNDSIVIHESDGDPDLDFLSKNFKYKTCKFSEFCLKLRDTSKSVYLRSTSNNTRDGKRPAMIEKDFPCIADDLKPPHFIPYGSTSQLYHSSVLRIASTKVQIWTHFDLYDNILCQVSGSKRIVLFPPSDIGFLYIKGDKSLVNDLDNWQQTIEKFPLVSKTTPHRCVLNPGDSLFIPSLWWHNVRTIASASSLPISNHAEPSIGFNIFWKDQQIESKQYYAKDDIYGNKNLIPFDFALRNLDQAINHLQKLPEKYGNFYKFMLLEHLKRKLFPSQN